MNKEAINSVERLIEIHKEMEARKFSAGYFWGFVTGLSMAIVILIIWGSILK